MSIELSILATGKWDPRISDLLIVGDTSNCKPSTTVFCLIDLAVTWRASKDICNALGCDLNDASTYELDWQAIRKNRASLIESIEDGIGCGCERYEDLKTLNECNFKFHLWPDF